MRMNSAFNSQILAEKLRKLNNSQQSIETLSHWCIFHRKKARLVVETWEKQFRELSRERQVPFLYLANDILQNSRRRGGEFVTEFWKVLPTVLKEVLEKGNDRVHNVVLRLVDIWDDRKVFGSRTRTLRDELLGNEPLGDLAEHRVKLNHTIKIKVPVGGIQEKLTSAYRSVQDVASDEDATLGRCNAAVIRIEGLEKEAHSSGNLWESHDTTLADEFQEQENILTQCAEQLEMSELARAALVSHLKEALREQESKLELIRTQLQTARSRAEQSGILRQRLLQSGNAGIGEIVEHGLHETAVGGIEGSKVPQNTCSLHATLPWPEIPFTEGLTNVVEEAKNPRSVAAEVAAKLAASASSAQMLQSVLSSFVAQEASNARSESAALEVSTTAVPDKRQKVNNQNEHTKSGDSSPTYSKLSAPAASLHSSSMPLQSSSQTVSSSSSQLQYMLPLRPAILPQSQFASIHLPGFRYASTAPAPAPMLPPPPPPSAAPIQQQVVVGVPSSMSINSQNTNPGAFQSLQPPGVTYYGQLPLPAPNAPRQ